MKPTHSCSCLVFYDGSCGLCDRMVQFILKRDKNKRFAFAPLQGETASRLLRKMPAEIRFSDSLVLIENYQTAAPKVFLYAKGALRIAWLLGFPWSLLGLFSFLPGGLTDWIYHLVAEKRHLFFKDDSCAPLQSSKCRDLQPERFLP